MKHKVAIIIGAGPAGITAAIQFQRLTGIRPILVEAADQVGGLSRTVRYKGNRMDIGGHRFFSKSDQVTRWWLDILPIEDLSHNGDARGATDRKCGLTRDIGDENSVMLVRERKSRIYFMRRFFDYPIRLTASTLRKLGLLRTFRAGVSYLHSMLLRRSPERSLEDFLINRFGKQIYKTFFKSYTEKVWGVPCHEISAEWGVQRIQGLSLRRVVTHFVSKAFRWRQSASIAQKKTETSLIERFLYPKFGPGQLWERAVDLVLSAGGELHLGIRIDRVNMHAGRVVSVEGVKRTGERVTFNGDYFISSMPIRDLINSFNRSVPAAVRDVSNELVYRDFITVGILARKLAVIEEDGTPLKDNWIYVQEPDVLLGRVQIFNNWSPSLVSDSTKVWVGLEYFCNEADEMWNLPDSEMSGLAIREISKIGIVNAADVEDTCVVRVSKAYPAYFGSYNRFDQVRSWLDPIENLFLVGRNGMHKYNNQDHSMLTAMAAVSNIQNGITTKDNIWAVNTEAEYNEE